MLQRFFNCMSSVVFAFFFCILVEDAPMRIFVTVMAAANIWYNIEFEPKYQELEDNNGN